MQHRIATGLLFASVGFIAGALAMITALTGPASQPTPQRLKPAVEMLGEVTTVMSPDDPLYREAVEIDRLEAANKRDDWK